MPQNLVIPAFTLGAVLLLISLVGGKFKIFGAEISGTAGRAGRLIAFVIGVTLIVGGLFPEAPKADNKNVNPQPSQVVPPASAPSRDIHKNSGYSLKPIPPSPEPVVQLVPTPAQPTPMLDVEWQDGTQELQQLAAGLSPQEQTNLGLNVLMTGMDMYGARVRITNTGEVPVKISPTNIRIHFGNEGVGVITTDDPRFLHAAVVQPNYLLEGLVIYKARIDIGAAIRQGQGGTLSYEDHSVQVTYNARPW